MKNLINFLHGLLPMPIKYHYGICMNPGCGEMGKHVTPCFYPDNDDDIPDAFFCSKHAYKNGFCWGCGQFWAGVESFDFSKSELCENCEEQEYDEYDEYDNNDDYYSDQCREEVEDLP